MSASSKYYGRALTKLNAKRADTIGAIRPKGFATVSTGREHMLTSLTRSFTFNSIKIEPLEFVTISSGVIEQEAEVEPGTITPFKYKANPQDGTGNGYGGCKIALVAQLIA